MDLKKHKIGVYYRENRYSWHYTNRQICSCGTNFATQRKEAQVCPNCSNSDFIEVYTIPKKKKVVDSIVEVLDKSNLHFNVRKTDIVAIFEDGRISRLEKGKVNRLYVNLKDKVIKLFDSNGVEIEKIHNAMEAFTKGVKSHLNFIDAVSTDQNRALFQFALTRFGTIGREKTPRLHRVFHTIMCNPFLEIMYNCGFKPNTVWQEKYHLYQKETTPAKILGVPKYLVKFMSKGDCLSQRQIETLNKLDKKFNGNNLKAILTILDEESTISQLFNMYDRLTELYDYYGFKDVKKLTLYLAREVKLEQGIGSPSNAITTLRDYVRMSKEMGLEYEKYPKSLKKEHDIAQLNYKMLQNMQKKEEFTQVINKEDYIGLEFKNRQYSIVVPKEPQDVVKEGESLSHCVASYVNDIIKEKCKILFMRPTANTEMSLLTIEVRDKYVRQIRGKQNRKAQREEMNFIHKWADKLNLQVTGY